MFHVKLLGKNAKKAFNFTRKKRNPDRFSPCWALDREVPVCGYYVKFEN
jgi:hypothetical protein